MSTTNDEIQQERRDECRLDVLGYLVERQALAFHPRVIMRRLNEGHLHDFTEEEVLAACIWLVGDGKAKLERPEMGASKYYQATSEGVLAYERMGRL